MNIIGIDVGGSAVKGAIVDTTNGQIVGELIRIAIPERASVDHVLKAACAIRAQCGPVDAAGIGFPGVIRRGKVSLASNLADSWEGADAAALLHNTLNLRVSVVNDADAAALAEARFGAGASYDGSILVITLGTGVGSALVHHGRLFPNLELGELMGSCGKMDEFASAATRTRQGLGWRDWAERVNELVAASEKLLSPELIIFGGGVSESHQEWLPYLRARAEIRAASLGNPAGVVGAALAATELYSVDK